MPDPLPIEETPEIPMDMPEPPQPQVPPPPPMPTVSRRSSVLPILILIILVGAGLFLSGYIRPFLSGMNKGSTQGPTPTIAATPTPVDPTADWKSTTIGGISFKLPSDVLAPVCDGTSCVSQGTYLPGGTRLTIATRGSRAFVTDANGVSFVNTEATVSGHAATEFTGIFAGRTTGGYGFTQMHGFMLEVTPTLTLEINHFTPTGVTADFAKDDALFDQIVASISFTPETPIITSAPTQATTSGY